MRRHLEYVHSVTGPASVEINYVCADFIGDTIAKITSNKGRGSKARVLYLEGIFVIESPIKSKQK